MPAGPYAKLNDSTATGQGVGDMKGGDVAIITALQALQTIGRLKDMNIVVYMTSDEERSGRPHALARKDFIERARTCDIALGFEPGGLNKAVAARRGASSWKVDITAKTGHSATVFSDSAGDGAIYEAARILNSFREQLSAEQYLTFNPGGTGKDNIIAPTTGINGDLRFITDGQKDSAREKMRAIVAASLPGTHSTITFSDGLPAMPPTPGNLRLIDQLNNISNAMGIGDTEAEDPGQRGAGDISDAAPYIDCVDGLGAPGAGAHKPGETIHLKQYPLLIERAAILMDRLTR
jgi:glutamate carboxypeptidase